MDNNPTPTPQPTPDVPAGDNPAPAAPAAEPAAPAPSAAPAPEPAAPVPPASPAAPIEPAVPGAPAAPAIDAQPKKKSNMTVLLIIIIAVAVLGIGALVLIYFLTHSPDKLVNNSVMDLLKKDSIGVNLQVQLPDDNGDLAISTFSANNTVYLRTDNLDFLTKSDATSSITRVLGEEGTKKILSEITGKWWKIDASSSSSSSSSSIGIDMSSLTDAFKDRNRILNAWKEHPFIKAAKANNGIKYPTSGDAFVLSIDAQQLDAFGKAAFDNYNSSSSSISTDSLTDDSTTVVVTVKSSLFGGGTLTGAYFDKAGDDYSDPVHIALDLEHAITAAPADAKDASELMETIQKAALEAYSSSYSGNYSSLYDLDYDDDWDYDYDDDWDYDYDDDWYDYDYDYDFSSLDDLDD